ncbi:MAG: isoprenylcysteine carboxylmethyltransferase family protein [Candidatus Omnitrophica bacterium]|nr:isoprenylcysteine carboxylmethyltransferase family protein [Candidatus Omnitrophota bacterium]
MAASYHESGHQSYPITAGPYAWVRHPLYVANFLLGLGIALVAGWWPMVAVYLLVFLPIHALIMRSEEVHLTNLYGERYAAYQRAVPGVIPFRMYRGPRYGSRSSFKLRKGKEWLKVAGYLAGMAAILAFKRLRGMIEAPGALRQLPWEFWVAGLAITAAAVNFRPQTRLSWVRVSQTAAVIVIVALLAIQVPSVIPSPAAPLRTASPPTASVQPIRPTDEAPPVKDQVQPWGALADLKAVSPAKPNPLFGALWSHLDLVAGITTFLAAGLSEGAFETSGGSRDHELQEASQTALLAAVGTALCKQWIQSHPALALWDPHGDAVQFKVHPIIHEEGVGFRAAFKRRF